MAVSLVSFAKTSWSCQATRSLSQTRKRGCCVRNVLYSLHSIMCHKNNFQSPTRTYPIIRLHEHWVIFHVLEWYSTNQIPFCHSRLCSMTCHFFVNNLHFITYSNPSEKIHMEPNGTDSELSMQFSHVLT